MHPFVNFAHEERNNQDFFVKLYAFYMFKTDECAHKQMRKSFFDFQISYLLLQYIIRNISVETNIRTKDYSRKTEKYTGKVSA